MFFSPFAKKILHMLFFHVAFHMRETGMAGSTLFRYAMMISLQKLIHVIKQIQQVLEYRDTTAKY